MLIFLFDYILFIETMVDAYQFVSYLCTCRTI